MSIQKKAKPSKPLQAAALYALLGMLPSMISIFTLPIYLRHLSVEDYGALSLLLFFGHLFGMVASLQLNAGASVTYFDYDQEASQLKQFKSTIFTFALLVSAVNFVVFSIVGPFFFDSFLSHSSVSFGKEGLIVMSTAMLSQLQIIYIMYQRNAYHLKVCLAYSLTSLFLGVGFQYFLIVERGMGVTGSVLGSLMATAIITIYLLLSNSHLITFRIDRSVLRPTLKLSLPLIPLIFLEWFFSAGARLFVEQMMTLADVGRISLIITFMLVTNKLFNSIWSGFSPELFRLLKSGESLVLERMAEMVSMHIRIGLLVISTTLLLGCNLTLITDNDKYLQIIPLLPLASLAMIPKMLTSVPTLKLMSEKKSKTVLSIMSGTTLILIIGFISMIPFFGLKGALLAFMAANLMNFLVRCWKSRSFCMSVLFTTNQLLWIGVVPALMLVVLQLRFLTGISYEYFGLIQFLVVFLFLLVVSKKELTLAFNQVKPLTQSFREKTFHKSTR